MAYEEPGPVFDCGRFNPMRSRIRTNPDGSVVSERLPQGKYLKVVNSAGHVVPLKLHNAISLQTPFDEYKMRIIAQKTRAAPAWGIAAMFLYGECPQAGQYQFNLPPDMQTGRRCLTAKSGAPIDDDHPCECIEALIARRREANGMAMTALENESSSAQIKRRMEATEKANADLAGAVGKLVEAMGTTVTASQPAPAPRNDPPRSEGNKPR